MIDYGWMLIAFVGEGFIAILLTAHLSRLSWQWECVKRGFARYNPTTGEWEWIEK